MPAELTPDTPSPTNPEPAWEMIRSGVGGVDIHGPNGEVTQERHPPEQVARARRNPFSGEVPAQPVAAQPVSAQPVSRTSTK